MIRRIAVIVLFASTLIVATPGAAAHPGLADIARWLVECATEGRCDPPPSDPNCPTICVVPGVCVDPPKVSFCKGAGP